MATIETPPKIVPEEPRNSPNGFHDDKPVVVRKSRLSEEEFHFLISELRDENSRSRMREAVWISIIVHLILVFIVKESPRIWPHAKVTLVTPSEMVNQQRLTYLDQKPDTQRVPKVETNKLSDKNRIAMAKNPKLKRLLDELRDNRRTGAPAQQAQQQQQAQPAQASPQAAAQQQQQQPAQQQPQQQSQTQAQQQPNPFTNYRGSA